MAQQEEPAAEQQGQVRQAAAVAQQQEAAAVQQGQQAAAVDEQVAMNDKRHRSCGSSGRDGTGRAVPRLAGPRVLSGAEEEQVLL